MAPDSMDSPRGAKSGGYVVLGAPGSGKTHLAAELSARTGLQVVELDAFYWLPGWERRAKSEFVALVAEVLKGGPTIVVGNYLHWVPPISWGAAGTIVWLDLSRRITMLRLIKRTVRQAWRREEIVTGCRQSIRAAIRDGLFTTGWTLPAQLRERVPALLKEQGIAAQVVVRLRTPREVRQWTGGVVRP